MYGKIWTRRYQLDRMTLGGLTAAFFQYHAVWAYLLCASGAVAGFWFRPAALVQTLAAVAAAGLIYPLIGYVLPHWALHTRGFETVLSEANFLLVKVPAPFESAGMLLAALAERDVPRLSDSLRITIGTVAENKCLIEAGDHVALAHERWRP